MDTLHSFFVEYSYYAVFAVLIICGLGVPVPEDITLVTAGIISGLGHANQQGMVIISYLGVLLGDWIVFAVGARYGMTLTRHPWFSRLLSAQRLAYIKVLFQRYGERIIFFSRFTPGLRTPIFIFAGMNHHISFGRFTLIDGFAALISVPVWVYLGYYGASNKDWLTEKVKEFRYISIAILVIGVGMIGYLYWRRRQRILFFRDTRRQLRGVAEQGEDKTL